MADIEVGSEVLYAEADGVVRKGFALQAGDVPDPIAVEARSDINSTVAATFVVIVGNPSAGQVALDSAGTASNAATASAQATGVSSNTPLALNPVVSGAWTYDETIDMWTQRFSNVEFRRYIESPVVYDSALFTVQDHNDNPNGRMTLRVLTASLFVPPVTKAFIQRASANSLGDGSIQQIDLPIAIYGAPAEMRLVAETGLANAPASAALHYQIQQLRVLF